MLRMLVAATLLGLTSAALDAFDCTFKSSYPEQYVVYKTDTPPKVDGKIGVPLPRPLCPSTSFRLVHWATVQRTVCH